MTVRARSAIIRAGLVTGMPSRLVRSAAVDRCTWASGLRLLWLGGTVISRRPGRNPDTPNSTAALRCDMTAAGPAMRHAASARCSHVTGAPDRRYTPPPTRTHRPVSNRRRMRALSLPA